MRTAGLAQRVRTLASSEAGSKQSLKILGDRLILAAASKLTINSFDQERLVPRPIVCEIPNMWMVVGYHPLHCREISLAVRNLSKRCTMWIRVAFADALKQLPGEV